MEWTDHTREQLEVALNESDVVGVRVAEAGTSVDVLLHVLALPPASPLSRDGRRVLRLSGASELRFLLREDRAGLLAPERPAIPLSDLAAVERFFESLVWGGSIYGWHFFDDPSLTEDWPADLSLVVPLRSRRAGHTFYWFNECGADSDGGPVALVIEGTVTFDDLCVLDFSGAVIPVEHFIADGVRQWDAFYAHDPRLSVTAQQEAQQDAPKWREWARSARSAIVPSGEPDA